MRELIVINKSSLEEFLDKLVQLQLATHTDEELIKLTELQTHPFAKGELMFLRNKFKEQGPQ